MRPLTIFSGQWTDMPLVTFAKKAASWGYEGIEVACGAHLDPVKAAKSKKYCKEFLDTLKVNNLNLYAISNHLAGQLVCDPDDDFRTDVLYGFCSVKTEGTCCITDETCDTKAHVFWVAKEN